MSLSDYDYAIATLRAALVADCGERPITAFEALTWPHLFDPPPADADAPSSSAGAFSEPR